MTNKAQQLERFRSFFDRIDPTKTNAERVKICARYALLSESSVRVYLSDSATHGPSERTLSILEKELKKRRL